MRKSCATHEIRNEVEIRSVKSSLFCFVGVTQNRKSVNVISVFMLILLIPPLDHVFQIFICLGRGAHGHGRVNALRAQHIALLSLYFLFTLLSVQQQLSQRNHMPLVSQQRATKTQSTCFPPSSFISTRFSPQSCTTGTMTWIKPHWLVCCNCRIVFENAVED